MGRPFRSLLLAAPLALSACATMSAERRAAFEAEAQPAVLALQAARFDDALGASKALVTREPDNSRALGVYALSMYRLALHDLATDAVTVFSSALASGLMGGDYLNRDFLDFAVSRADGRLAEVDAALGRASMDQQFSLELCLACWEVDWNRNGEVDDRDRRLLEVERDAQGELLPVADVARRRPTFRFDWADLYWLRAMVSFQRAALALVAAYDPDLSGLRRGNVDVLKLKLRDPKQVARARDLLLAGLDHARDCRRAALAEIDDDREWLPSPRQKSHALPLPVDDALFETWAGVLDDLEQLVRGEKGLSVAELAQLGDHRWETPPGGFVDVALMFKEPADIVLPLEDLQRAHRRSAGEASELLGRVLGRAYRASMPASALPARLTRMRKELDAGEDTLERKLRYLLWLN